MLLPVRYSNCFAGIGITIFALVRASIVLSNILADDAPTKLSLTFVPIILSFKAICCLGIRCGDVPGRFAYRHRI